MAPWMGVWSHTASDQLYGVWLEPPKQPRLRSRLYGSMDIHICWPAEYGVWLYTYIWVLAAVPSEYTYGCMSHTLISMHLAQIPTLSQLKNDIIMMRRPSAKFKHTQILKPHFFFLI